MLTFQSLDQQCKATQLLMDRKVKLTSHPIFCLQKVAQQVHQETLQIVLLFAFDFLKICLENLSICGKLDVPV